MGTRGCWGFCKDGITKAVYRHFDSYPSGLGAEVIGLVHNNDLDKLKQLFDNIEVVDPNVMPTDEQKQYFKDMYWTEGEPTEKTDWYWLTHMLQYPEAWYKAIENGNKVLIKNDIDFIKDSLFCEYAYIFDLNDMTLYVYEGFQKQPFEGNPYGEQPDEDGYYPCCPKCYMTAELIKSHDVYDLVQAVNKCMGEGDDES